MDPFLAEVLSGIAGGVGSTIVTSSANGIAHRLFRRTAGEASALSDQREIAIWRERMATVAREVFENIDATVAEAQSYEPNAQHFADDALRSAIESPSEEKRALLGRLIVRRMDVRTESFYELQLRTARKIAAGASSDQLACLAVVVLLFDTPAPYDAAQQRGAWYRELLYSALATLTNAQWDSSDLDHLVSQAALQRAEHYPSRSRAGAIFQRFGADVHNDIRELVGQGRYGNHMPAHPPLWPYWTTPTGAVLGSAVLERLIGRRIYFAEWEERENLAPSDLVSPYSSAYIEQSAALRQTEGELQTKRIIQQEQQDLALRLRRHRP